MAKHMRRYGLTLPNAIPLAEEKAVASEDSENSPKYGLQRNQEDPAAPAQNRQYAPPQPR
ncbi:hypothetical protein [Caballeronia sp. SBC2]|uniref:hypothetical protein n=1 Tax=Caballeronia sp. SBC2 TaxID=2705547 RepID=UPI0019D07611|nr:hypothetical protein [Caballeronia sp. SBC2]